jgi:hypothetical protein
MQAPDVQNNRTFTTASPVPSQCHAPATARLSPNAVGAIGPEDTTLLKSPSPGHSLRDEEGWRVRADSRRRPRLRLRPVAIVVRLRSTCRTSTGVSNPQLGQSLVPSAVLHLTKDEWRLNHIGMGRSLGQVSSVHATASSRWTPTVPEHSDNGKARIVPPRRESRTTGRSTMDNVCPRNSYALFSSQQQNAPLHSLKEVTRNTVTED